MIGVSHDSYGWICRKAQPELMLECASNWQTAVESFSVCAPLGGRGNIGRWVEGRDFFSISETVGTGKEGAPFGGKPASGPGEL